MILGTMELLVLLFLVIPFIPWLIALIDILKSDFPGNDKIIWFLLVLFVPIAGMIIYFVLGRKRKILRDRESK